MYPKIFKTTFSLYLTLLLLECEPALSAPKQSNLSKHPVLLVVSFDGFRLDYLTKNVTPNLQTVQNEGTSALYMQAQFPTKTFPNHHSIATGLYPDSHGITDNVVFDPVNGTSLSGFNDDPGFWNYHPDVIPFWIRNEQAGDGRVSGCYMWSGSSQGYGSQHNLFPKYYIPKYDGSVPWESRVETVISWMTNDTNPANVVFLYHNEPDSKGHSFGTDHNETITEIRNTDNRLGHLIQKLKDGQIYDDINLIVLSDHGMHSVTRDKMINTSAIMDTTLYFRHGGSPVHHIRPRDNSTDAMIYNTFKNASESSNFTVYRKHEMGHLNYVTSRRIMDIVLVADEGYAFDDISNNLNATGVYGVHGYDPAVESMKTIFVARGPAFKKNFTSQNFIQNVDLFPLMSNILGITPAPNNGTLDRVQQFLSSAAPTVLCSTKLALLSLLLSLVQMQK